ncbi:hypothetical protein LEP1GSC062_3174 [Leptospira alexanderi serovar Manhao 3 str. L 60]|uniref:Uncharacterized protein n=1 Tax=Leptospira alexanderi serovar Manhao 3 str. L 60 TaxID=1049759 RepID=V6HVQ2_9LEPT|nr:hypothetical protein LEP1GSC062_3174 [Leptospira alexanderi serovar Manhao 3 str. L 60]
MNNPDTNKEDFGKDSDFNRKMTENTAPEKSEILFFFQKAV